MGLGVAATATIMNGAGVPGYVSYDERVAAAAPFLRSSLRLDIGKDFRLCAVAMVGASVPRVVVKFAVTTPDTVASAPTL